MGVAQPFFDWGVAKVRSASVSNDRLKKAGLASRNIVVQIYYVVSALQ